MEPVIQAILFDMKAFDREAAQRWLKERGFNAVLDDKPVGTSWRSVQIPATSFRSQTFNAQPGPTTGTILMKGEPNEGAEEQLFQRAGTLFAQDLGPHEVDFICSTAAVDSYGDVVVQEGINLAHFRRNPIVLFNHSTNQPIGKATKVDFDAKGNLVARFKFADATLGQLGVLADSVYKMIAAGFINACSIGFTSIEREPIFDSKGNFTGIKFLKSIIKEISVVSVPANHQALVQARSLGIPESVLRQVVIPNGQAPDRVDVQRRLAQRQRAALHFGQLPSS